MKYLLTLLILIFLITPLFAREIRPAFVMQSKGMVNDFVLDGLKLYVANDEGSVEIFDLRERRKTGEIFIQPMKTTKGDWVNVKILSVDRRNGKTLIVSTAEKGYRNIWLHDGKKLHPVITQKRKSTVKKARFIDDKNFLFGTLGYDIIRYTLNDDYKVYKHHIEESAFSDMVLSTDKKTAVTASESGQVTIIDTQTGKILKQPVPLNLDNIYKVAYQNGNIITAGQDRRVGVYPQNAKPYAIKSNFLVYCVGLSPSGKLGVYSSNEENDLQLFNVESGKKLHILTGHESIPSTIRFFDEDGFFSAGYGNTIYYWYLKDYNKSR
jgi:WD40 repeat protein